MVVLKLSTRGKYGFRAILELAINYGNGPIPLKNVSERLDISQKYLGQLVAFLKMAGLVKSVRGAHGGYALARHPSEIKLSEVIRTLEGSIAPSECVNDSEVCPRSKFCVTRGIWTKMKEAMNGVLESTTLQDLVEQQRAQEQRDEIMYYI
jgi:Rrf2 family protein